MTLPQSESSNVEVKGLVKYFGNDRAVDGISFKVPQGGFLTLLGPSGCGKTTTLMCIAGLHHFDAGEIWVGDSIYSAPTQGMFLPPEKRDIGMVFQSYAIWPHMTVSQNVAYPLEVRNTDPQETAERVSVVLKLVGLGDYADKMATQLSGGQQQRAALARAIVSRPKLLLFDEPLSNLDLKLREKMRVEIKRIQNEVGITSIFVTHDQAEALVMSDEILVMSKGRIEQRGGPHNIYAHPLNRYVSNFIGVANLLEGRVLRLNGSGGAEFETSGDTPISLPCQVGEGLSEGASAVLCIRPENVKALHEHQGGARVEGEVLQTIFLGNCIDCRVRWGEFEWKVLAHPRDQLRRGDRVFLHMDPEHSLAVLP
jgi:iron(III) transport system ATP-binding protein